MTPIALPLSTHKTLTLRQAALIAGFAYLLMPVSYAEFHVFPLLLVPGNIEETVQNIGAHQTLFIIGFLCHLITLFMDLIIAWALYLLLAPVNTALSLFAAWCRIVFAVVALVSLLKLPIVFRLLTVPYFHTIFGDQQLHAQVQLLLSSFRYEFAMSLVVFGVHLALIGFLIIRSGYIPRLLGVLLLIVGVGWVIYPVKPYLYPNAKLDFIPYIGFGELVFPLWLLARGWKIAEPGGDVALTNRQTREASSQAR